MAAAIPIIVAGAAAGVTVGTVAGAVVIGFSVKAALVGAGLALAGSVVQRALTSSPPEMPSFQQKLRDRALTVRQPVAPRRLLIGRSRVGGVLTFVHTTGEGNQYLHLVITISGNQISSIDNIYFDGEDVPISGSDVTGKYAGLVKFYHRLGVSDQTAIQELIDAAPDKWTSDHRQRGCAHVYLRLEYNQDKFPSGIPNITFGVQGSNEVYDPRDSSTGYSENPALAIAWYLANPTYGLGAAYSEIEGVDASANICDESVALAAGGTEPRYALNGVIDTSQTPREILQSMLTAMSGDLTSQGILWYLYAGAYRTPTVTLNENDLIGPVKFQTLHSRQDLFNSVQGVFVSPENEWQPTDFPPVKVDSWIAEDGEEIWQDARLDWTISSTMAQRICRQQIEIQRRQINGVLQCKTRAWEIMAGETFKLSIDRFGWNEKVFFAGSVRLVQIGLAVGVEIEFSEIDAAAYTWTSAMEGDPIPAPKTTLPSAFEVEPPGLTFREEFVLSASGMPLIDIVITITPPDDVYVIGYEVEAKHVDDDWYSMVGRGASLEYRIKDVVHAENYAIRARSYNAAGVHSPWTYENHQAEVLYPDPPVTPDPSVEAVGEWAVVSWADCRTSLAIAWYEVNGVRQGPGLRYTERITWVGDKVFNVKAVDVAGNESGVGSATLTITSLNHPTAILTTGKTYAIRLDITFEIFQGFEALEIWASDVNNRTDAVKVGETASNVFSHTGLPLIATRYYWIRSRDIYGNHSGWYPESPTAGVSGNTSTDPADYLEF